MKFDVLASIAHNIADSLSGCSILTGVYGLNAFEDAARSDGGYVEIDLLAGQCTHGDASHELVVATRIAAAEALPELCAKAGGAPSEFRALRIRYFAHPLGPWFDVTVENASGRRRTDRYLAWPGRRAKSLDALGRVRTKRR